LTFAFHAYIRITVDDIKNSFTARSFLDETHEASILYYQGLGRKWARQIFLNRPSSGHSLVVERRRSQPDIDLLNFKIAAIASEISTGECIPQCPTPSRQPLEFGRPLFVMKTGPATAAALAGPGSRSNASAVMETGFISSS
jgi:hypothetical protein